MEKKLRMSLLLCSLLFLFLVQPIISQDFDDDDDDEDWDAYADLDYTDTGSKSYANAKINGLSPQRFVTVGWDVQGPYDARFSQIGNYPVDLDRNDAPLGESARATYTGGLRVNANIPVVSRNNVIWQMGFNYMETAYRFSDYEGGTEAPGLVNALENTSLKTTGLFSTVYKPLNETTFLLFQGQVDMSGNYNFSNLGDQFFRYSAAAIWGKRPNDRKQWGLGISRTYRVGNMNYIPVLMYNWTSRDKKWGTEVLFPARGHVRYNFSNNSLLLFGFELEGNSYRIAELSTPDNSFEIRRGELRPRFEYQRRLVGYFWWAVQGGLRIDYSYDADQVPEGRDFFRGFFGEQEFAMKNTLAGAPYFNVSISFVSP